VKQYCGGPVMMVDWGEEDPDPAIERTLLRRVFSYFGRRRGVLALASIVARSVLAPAIVFKTLIDYLGKPAPSFGHVALIVAAGLAAAVGVGLLGVAESYLTESISQGIVYDLRQQMFSNLSRSGSSRTSASAM
jgi:ATP-binding cassette subfamily B protein